MRARRQIPLPFTHLLPLFPSPSFAYFSPFPQTLAIQQTTRIRKLAFRRIVLTVTEVGLH